MSKKKTNSSKAIIKAYEPLAKAWEDGFDYALRLIRDECVTRLKQRPPRSKR